MPSATDTALEALQASLAEEDAELAALVDQVIEAEDGHEDEAPEAAEEEDGDLASLVNEVMEEEGEAPRRQAHSSKGKAKGKRHGKETADDGDDDIDIEEHEEPHHAKAKGNANGHLGKKDKGARPMKKKKRAASEDDVDIDMDDEEEDAKLAKPLKGKGKGAAKPSSRHVKKKKMADADTDGDDEDDDEDQPVRKKGKKGKGKGRKQVDKDSSSEETSEDDDSDKDDGEGWNDEGVVKGVIAKFFDERSFGFVRPEGDGDDMFFHVATIWNKGEHAIVPGLPVKFYHETDEYNGKLKSTAMKVTSWKPKEIPPKGKGKGKGKEKGKKGGKDDWWTELEKWWKDKGKGDGNTENGTKKRPGQSAEDNDQPVRKASKDDEPQSVAEWTRAQERLFGHMSPLPEHWIRIRSKNNGAVYRYNFKTGESKDGDGNTGPSRKLPPNWQMNTSKSSGEVYYYNSKTGTSQFEEP